VSQKLLIIVLVVLVLIFLITLGMSACKGSGDPNPGSAGAVDRLEGLQGNRFLEIGDDASVNPSSCGSPGGQTLTVNGTCVVTFDKRAFFRKSTRVAFTANKPIFVTIVPKDGPRQEENDMQPLAAFRCFGSSVGRSGGTMTLSGTNATVFLRQEGCPPE
jgi:hypothetical protein